MVAIAKRLCRFSALLPIVLLLAVISPAQTQKTAVGSVRGVVQTAKGKGVGGFWLIIDNPDLGVNYRTDVNPIGQFQFTDVYPGPYVFKVSPNSYTVVSPAQIQVRNGQSMTVTVVVNSASNTQPGGSQGK